MQALNSIFTRLPHVKVALRVFLVEPHVYVRRDRRPRSSSFLSRNSPADMSSPVGPVGYNNYAQQEPQSDAPSARRRQARSSSRPRAPPSVSTPGMQSDANGFPDDEIVGLRGMRRNNLPGNRDIPRVVDTTAETLGIQFERFLDGYVKTCERLRSRLTTVIGSLTSLRRRRVLRRAQ